MPIYGLLWLVAIIVFIVLEAVSNQMISIWFVAGSVAAMIASIVGAGFWIQFVIFIALSLVTLLGFRPVTLKMLKNPNLKTNADALIGKTILITEDVSNIKGTGQGKINGLEWKVQTDTGAEIKAGSTAKIKSIEGVKLIVDEEE